MATNTSFEDAGAGQGEADGWTATGTGAAQGYAGIEAGDGLLYAWEGFDGWVSGQAEYRFDGFGGGDTTAGAAETFGAWITGLEEYRDAFAESDLTAGAAETFEAWATGQEDYRFEGFDPGDTTAGSTETFASWVTDQAEYRAAFDPGDTSTGTFQLGPATTGAAETFEGCRADAVAVATPSDSMLSVPGHAFQSEDPVQWDSTGTPPAPFKKGVTYYSLSPDVDEMELSATPLGSAITPTDAGTGVHKIIGAPSHFWRNPRSAW